MAALHSALQGIVPTTAPSLDEPLEANEEVAASETQEMAVMDDWLKPMPDESDTEYGARLRRGRPY